LFVRQTQIITDLGEKRRDGEPDEEGTEEGPPGAVKGSHVRAGKVAHLDNFTFVTLIRIHRDGIRLELLPFLLWDKRRKNEGIKRRKTAIAS
jgi:hypothetical protein